jgi:hypothetical protein
MIKTWTERREDKNGKPTMNNEARMKAEIAELREENKTLRDAWSAEPVGYISEHEKDSAMDKFRYLPSKMYPTPVYTRNQS